MIQVHKHNRSLHDATDSFCYSGIIPAHTSFKTLSVSTVCAFYETNNNPSHCFSRVMYIEQSLHFCEDATQRNRLLGLIRFVKISKS